MKILHKLIGPRHTSSRILTRLWLPMLAAMFLIGIGGCEKYEFPLNEIEDPEIKSFTLS